MNPKNILFKAAAVAVAGVADIVTMPVRFLWHAAKEQFKDSHTIAAGAAKAAGVLGVHAIVPLLTLLGGIGMEQVFGASRADTIRMTTVMTYVSTGLVAACMSGELAGCEAADCKDDFGLFHFTRKCVARLRLPSGPKPSC